ncbi:hypothetical protein D3C81_1103910 [compost metagenome]
MRDVHIAARVDIDGFQHIVEQFALFARQGAPFPFFQARGAAGQHKPIALAVATAHDDALARLAQIAARALGDSRRQAIPVEGGDIGIAQLSGGRRWRRIVEPGRIVRLGGGNWRRGNGDRCFGLHLDLRLGSHLDDFGNHLCEYLNHGFSHGWRHGRFHLHGRFDDGVNGLGCCALAQAPQGADAHFIEENGAAAHKV